MSGPFGSSQWMYSSGAAFYPFAIDQSLRFNDNDTAYLSRTPASAGNRKTWTWSGWIKRSNLGAMSILGLSSGAAFIRFNASNQLEIFYDASGAAHRVSNAVFRDSSAWYHINVILDTTNGTDLLRGRAWVNGVELTWSSTRSITLNADYLINGAVAHEIGRYGSGPFDGYMAEINFIDGQALDATSFGEFKSGVWVAKEYTGSYGTNGFHLTFADSGAIGDDTSGNTNDWTANNLAATDVLPDSPTNNFAVMNPLWKSSNTVIEEGNLYLPSRGYYSNAVGTMGVSSGKWYFEARVGNNVGSYYTIGVIATDDNTFINQVTSGIKSNVTWSQFATIYNNGTSVSNPTSPNLGSTTATKIVGVALDLDNNKVYFHGNGTWVDSSDPSTNTGGTTIAAAIQGKTFVPLIGTNNVSGSPNTQVNFGQDGTFIGTETAQGNTDENGYGNFYYPVPSGFLSMCSANLSAGAIDPAQDDVPSDYFNTVLWTGDGSSSRGITGVGFQPDMVWTKRRSTSDNHHLFDSVRVVSTVPQRLFPNLTNVEDGNFGSLDSFDSDGFTIGANTATNASGETFVGWNWLAGNGTSSNTDGSITSTVSVNQKAGFSIVGYTGTGATGTVGHGLGVAPKFVIHKNRDASANWLTRSLGTGSWLSGWLNLTNALGSTGLTTSSTTFDVGAASDNNGSGNAMIAYCFAEVEGYSKFGSYTGNGSTDGPFVYCGFRPAWLMVKRTNSAADWVMLDTARDDYNIMLRRLDANSSAAENTAASYLDAVSNGFKIRTTNGNYNGNGSTYIFMAFAENPFKYANAR